MSNHSRRGKPNSVDKEPAVAAGESSTDAGLPNSLMQELTSAAAGNVSGTAGNVSGTAGPEQAGFDVGAFFQAVGEGALDVTQQAGEAVTGLGESLLDQARTATLGTRDFFLGTGVGDQEALTEYLELASSRIPNQDIIYEQLAHRFGYDAVDEKALALWGYRALDPFEDPATGFRMLVVVPDENASDKIREMHGAELRPVVIFRGTANTEGLADDASGSAVGDFQFAMNAADIAKNVAEARAHAGESGGKFDVTGHSLGGALAQLCAARMPSGVGRVVTFQSPRVSDRETGRVDDHNEQDGVDDQIRSTHYRADADLVPHAGESRTAGDGYLLEYQGIETPLSHTSFPLAQLNAARGNQVPGVLTQAGEDGQRMPVEQHQLADVIYQRDADVGPSAGAGDHVRHAITTALDEEINGRMSVGEWGRQNLLGGSCF